VFGLDQHRIQIGIRQLQLEFDLHFVGQLGVPAILVPLLGFLYQKVVLRYDMVAV
jgi:hypothetical protein